MATETVVAGLAGVNAGTSAICTVGKTGMGLNYRGYAIEDLAEHCCFEEVAHLLVHGRLPSASELEAYVRTLNGLRALPGALRDVLERLPAAAHPMDVLRTGCSVLGALEPEGPRVAGAHVADRLLATFGGMLLYWHQFHRTGRRLATAPASAAERTAAWLLRLLHGRPAPPAHVRALDVSLVLYAEHEFAASTFAARTTASTLSDFYSCICTAVGTLRGPLHGGANEAAMELLAGFASPDAAERGVLDKLARKELIMGFGHRVYKKQDPRSPIIKHHAQLLAGMQGGAPALLAVAERVEAVMQREKGMFTNLDFYAACVYHQLGFPTPFFTPVFVLARTAGWAAHVLEQRANNRLIRPGCVYNGPPATRFVPLPERSSKPGSGGQARSAL